MRKTRAQGQESRDMIGEGRGGAKERDKPQKSCRRDVEDKGHLGGKREIRRQESIGSVDVDPEDLDNIIEIKQR